MSLLPFFLGAVPRRYADKDFRLSITPDDRFSTVLTPMIVREYDRPWRQMGVPNRDMGSKIVSNKEQFMVNLDMQHFAPEEITVKTADGSVIIEGKHEEKEVEHGYISRQLTRRYILPQNCDPAAVKSSLSSDGVLTVIAPTAKNERSVPISQTGPVRKIMESQQNE